MNDKLFLATGDLRLGAAAEGSMFLESHVKAELPICATPEQLGQHPDIHRLPECTQAQANN